MNACASGRDRRGLGEDLPAAKVADDDVLVADGDDQEGRRGDAVQGGCRMGRTSPGMMATTALGVGTRRGGRRQGGDLRGEVRPGRMADQGEPPGSGRTWRRRRQHPHRVVDGRHGVGEEVLRHRPDVVLIPGEDHDLAVPDQVIDPGAVEPGIDREPAVEEDHHRGLLRPGPVRLEEPVRAGPLADLEPTDPRCGGSGSSRRPDPGLMLVGSSAAAPGRLHDDNPGDQRHGQDRRENSKVTVGPSHRLPTRDFDRPPWPLRPPKHLSFRPPSLGLSRFISRSERYEVPA